MGVLPTGGAVADLRLIRMATTLDGGCDWLAGVIVRVGAWCVQQPSLHTCRARALNLVVGHGPNPQSRVISSSPHVLPATSSPSAGCTSIKPNCTRLSYAYDAVAPSCWAGAAAATLPVRVAAADSPLPTTSLFASGVALQLLAPDGVPVHFKVRVGMRDLVNARAAHNWSS